MTVAGTEKKAMMIRYDLWPVLLQPCATNRLRLESGTAPPIADMFAGADIVFAVWPDAGILNYIMIKGRGVLLGKPSTRAR